MKSSSGNDSLLTVGQLARSASVGVPALRFYERTGLLPKPERSASNYRLYPTEAISRIRFIRRAQELGFTLGETKEILNLRVNSTTTCAQVRERAQAKIAKIEERIRSLRKMGKALATLADECGPEQSRKTCPILEHLEGHL